MWREQVYRVCVFLHLNVCGMLVEFDRNLFKTSVNGLRGSR